MSVLTFTSIVSAMMIRWDLTDDRTKTDLTFVTVMQDSCHWYCNTDLCNTGLKGDMPTNPNKPIQSRSNTSMLGGFPCHLTLTFSVLGLIFNYY